jgi:NAD(P)-dependent dehydrogenase (short-subunit alcohol dehydrogenase family)
VRRRPPAKQIRASVQHMLDAMTGAAAVVANGRLDVVASNALMRSLQADVFDTGQPPNLARYCFFDPRSRGFYDDWEAIADVTVQILRTEAGRNPHDRALTDLVGELATRSGAFRTRWASHDVRLHLTGAKQFLHPVVGDLSLVFNTMALPADPGLTLAVYTAEPGSSTEEKLALLASWAVTDIAARQDASATKP